MRIPDPGSSIVAFDAYFETLNARSEVFGAIAGQRSGDGKVIDGRFPGDGAGQTRSDWLSLNPTTWAMRAIRAPLAWGCETGAYGGSAVKVALLEIVHRSSIIDHPVA